MSFAAVVLTVALSASAFAQTPPAGGARPQTPAQPPATTPAQPAPKPAMALMSMNAILASCGNGTGGVAGLGAGKEASKKLSALNEKKMAEIQEKNKQLQALQTKLNTGGNVLNDAARGQLEKDIDKMQRDIQYTQTNAQAEFNDLQNELQAEFQKRLLPIIEEVAKEKNLHAVFSIADSGAAYVHPGLNITEEVVKRLDAKK